jgi:hypothetical protein
MADRLAQRLGIVGQIPSQQLSTASTVATSAAVDMSTADKVLVTLMIGAQTGTVGIALQAATSTNGSDFAAFSTPVQATGLTASNIIQTIELDAIKMPAGKRYLNAKITGTNSSTNTQQVACLIQAEPRYAPAPNLTAVQTAVNA